jgi:hypothetical protein
MFTHNSTTIHIVVAVVFLAAVALDVLVLIHSIITSTLIASKKEKLVLLVPVNVAFATAVMGVVLATALVVALTHVLIPQWVLAGAMFAFFVPSAVVKVSFFLLDLFLLKRKPSRRPKAQIQTNSLNQFQAIRPDPFQANQPDFHR